MVGVKLVEVEGDLEDLEAAFTQRTAAFVWFQGAMTGRGDLPLAQVLERCRAHNVPMIVDAAAQLPPVENLWAFTQQGAAGAVFSGGKELCGPQASGLVVGQRWLIDAMRPNGSPNASFGRPMKVGKEEMAGLLAAVRRYLTLDHTARRQRDEAIVAEWRRALGTLPGILAQRSFPNEAGQPSPRCEVRLTAQAKLTVAQLIQSLWAGTPAVAVGEGDDCIYLNPMTVTDEEAAVVLERVREALA
jgi:L-seryl-tRNA(Ser) seleniumtransferase